MDAIGLIYYAVVCGGVALFSPNVSNRLARLAIGLIAGAVSAFILPNMRAFF